MSMYKKLTSLLTRHDKKFLSVFVALVETVGISVASDFEVIQTNDIFNFDSNVNFVISFI